LRNREGVENVKLDELKPCPKCKGEIQLFSCGYFTGDSNCFARCKSCKKEFVVPTELKANGVKIYPASIKKAYRIWNENSEKLETR
jgi:transcription elongation factor Elf1